MAGKTRTAFAGVVFENQKSIVGKEAVARIRVAAGTSIADARKFVLAAFDRLLEAQATLHKKDKEWQADGSGAIVQDGQDPVIVTQVDGFLSLR